MFLRLDPEEEEDPKLDPRFPKELDPKPELEPKLEPNPELELPSLEPELELPKPPDPLDPKELARPPAPAPASPPTPAPASPAPNMLVPLWPGLGCVNPPPPSEELPNPGVPPAGLGWTKPPAPRDDPVPG